MRIRMRFVLTLTLIAGLVLAANLCAAQTEQPAQPRPKLREVPQEAPTAAGGAAQEQPVGQETAGEEPAGGKAPPAGRKGLFDSPWFLPVMIGGFILLYLWMGRSRRKQESKRKEMLASLKKGDKITSIGGIVGTVIEIREDEVTVKVDETNNIRMKFARWAIRGVGDDAKIKAPDSAR